MTASSLRTVAQLANELPAFDQPALRRLIFRAEANGLLVLVDDGAVSVAAPDLSGDSDLALRYGDTIHTLDAEMDARHQYAAVEAYGWDHAQQEVQQATGTAPAPTI